jgi:transcriptional regulator with XRE-family HTH domain
MHARDFYPIATKHVFRHYCSMNGDRFVKLLKARIEQDDRLTASGLAKRAGIDNSTIRKLISGENSSPTLSTAQKICAALGVSLEEFMGLDVDPLQAEIVDLYNQLSPEERRLLLSAARGLAADHHKAKPE